MTINKKLNIQKRQIWVGLVWSDWSPITYLALNVTKSVLNVSLKMTVLDRGAAVLHCCYGVCRWAETSEGSPGREDFGQ